MAARLAISLFTCVLLSASPLAAGSVAKVVLVGSTVDIGLGELIAGRGGDMSDRDIRALGVEITNRYHAAGYATSSVDRLVLRKSGVLELHVYESRIRDAAVTGIEPGRAEEIARLLYEPGEIYNRHLVHERARFIAAALRLSAITVAAENFRSGRDVLLRATVDPGRRGVYRLGLGYEPIYGYAPLLGYDSRFDAGMVRVTLAGGFRDGYLRRGTADIEYRRGSEKDGGSGALVGAGYAYSRDVWESQGREYLGNAGSAYAGYRWGFGSAAAECLLREIVSGLERYRDDWRVDSDTRFVATLRAGDRHLLLDRREASDLSFSLSGGRSDFVRQGYWMAAASGRTSLAPAPWLFIVPRFDAWYTSSGERYHWRYVFDESLPGFSGDFTASRWKNSAGLDLVFEAYPDMVAGGPFGTAGWYLNEDGDWRSAVVCGLKGAFRVSGVLFSVVAAWDVSRPLSKAGVSFSADGTL